MKSNLFVIFTLIILTISCNKKTNNLQKNTWWKEAIVYQLYPRSFQDTDGDGVGDLKGITQRLDYLQNLGINAIWLNPICASPNDDNGYDISNYKEIMKEMGTMKDFDEMLAGMKKRNIKLIMDLVLNHSSDEHNWFLEAKKSRTNKYYNYYHWWPKEKGTPPKRYSLFDENADAWRFNEATNSYYLHYFSRKQPDLNWENPVVRNEMYDIMKFWLDKGVSGFRLDAFPFMAKDTTWPDKSNLTNDQFVRYYGADEKAHSYLKEMNEKVLSKYNDVYTVGEGGVIPFSKMQDYVNTERNELNTLYHDELGNIWGRDTFDIGNYDVKKHNVVGLKQIVTKWDEKFLNTGWNTVFWGNHDQSRTVSRYGNDTPEYREQSAKMLYTFLLTQRALPYLYNGDEIGMTNIRFKTVEQYNDLQTRNRYYIERKKSPAAGAAYLAMQAELSRDNGRTPMQWNATPTAGFTTGKPWLTINENTNTVNVESQEKDKNSILNFVRNMIKLRNDNKDILVYGKYNLLDATNKNIFTFTRTNSSETFLVLLNFTKEISKTEIPKGFSLGNELINNLQPLKLDGANIVLQPYQAAVIKLK